MTSWCSHPPDSLTLSQQQMAGLQKALPRPLVLPREEGPLTAPGSQQHCRLWETQPEKPGTTMSPTLVILTVSPLCPGCPGSPSLPGGPWGKNQSKEGLLSSSKEQVTNITVLLVAFDEGDPLAPAESDCGTRCHGRICPIIPIAAQGRGGQRSPGSSRWTAWFLWDPQMSILTNTKEEQYLQNPERGLDFAGHEPPPLRLFPSMDLP